MLTRDELNKIGERFKRKGLVHSIEIYDTEGALRYVMEVDETTGKWATKFDSIFTEEVTE